MKNGVSHYVTGTAQVTVHFPEGRVCCQWCPLFLRYEENFKRYSCRLTGEWIFNPFHGAGGRCPIHFEGGDKDEISPPAGGRD